MSAWHAAGRGSILRQATRHVLLGAKTWLSTLEIVHPVPFGGDFKRRRSLLSGAHIIMAGEVKYPTHGVNV